MEMKIKERFKQAGLKFTVQRRMVYEVMEQLCHASIEEIIGKMQEKDPEITLSTVYRVLDSFCRAGLLSKMAHPSGKNYFDITPTEHYHIFSTDGKVVDYINPELTALIWKELQGREFDGMEIERINVQIITRNQMLN